MIDNSIDLVNEMAGLSNLQSIIQRMRIIKIETVIEGGIPLDYLSKRLLRAGMREANAKLINPDSKDNELYELIVYARTPHENGLGNHLSLMCQAVVDESSCESLDNLTDAYDLFDMELGANNIDPQFFYDKAELLIKNTGITD